MSAEILDLSGFEEIGGDQPSTSTGLNTLLMSGLDLDTIGEQLKSGKSIDTLCANIDPQTGKYLDSSVLNYVKCAKDVMPSEHEFLLRDQRFPLGEVTVLASAGGTGKGQLEAVHVAHATNGYNLEGYKVGEPKNCLIISAEDTAADIRRRLDRSTRKADMQRVFLLDKADSLSFGLDLSDPDSIEKFENLIRATKSSLVYVDPIQAFVGEYTDLSRQNHVRHVMHGLATTAERTHSVIVLLMHLNKRQSIANATDLLSGSSDIVNASRSVLLLTPDFKEGAEDMRYLFHVKSNHARKAPTLSVRIDSVGNQIVGQSDLVADDYVIALNQKRVAKATSKATPNFNELYFNGIAKMLANGETQSTFNNFKSLYAPTHPGRAKCVLDEICPRVEEEFGVTIQTSTSGSNGVRMGTERGFRLIPIS